MSMMKLKNILDPVVSCVGWGSRILLALVSSISLPALASYDVNIPPPATPISTQIFGLHLYILGFCAVIFVLVFSVMFYSIFKFRKSKGAKPDVNFHESTLIEIIWTIIPFFILLGMAPHRHARSPGVRGS